MFLRREVIDEITRSDEQMENYSKKTDEEMDIFLQTIEESVRNSLPWKEHNLARKKEEDDDRYKQISERITNMEKKIFDIDEKCVSRSDEPQESP